MENSQKTPTVETGEKRQMATEKKESNTEAFAQRLVWTVRLGKLTEIWKLFM